LNGSVQLPLGAHAAGHDTALLRGFAVVSHRHRSPGRTDSTRASCRNQQAALDFAYQAIGRIAVARQTDHRHALRQSPDRSYFAGCSTGGREAMLMAQRHPTFFDGIISGAPAMRTAYSGIGDEWVATMLNAGASKDPSGKVDPRAALSDAQKKAVIDGVVNACDANDGLKDDMIFNTKACRFDPKTLVCGAAKTTVASRWRRRRRSRRDLPDRRTQRAVRCIPASCSTPASHRHKVFRVAARWSQSCRSSVHGDDDGCGCARRSRGASSMTC
jgi:feruloyl esterase